MKNLAILGTILFTLSTQSANASVLDKISGVKDKAVSVTKKVVSLPIQAAGVVYGFVAANLLMGMETGVEKATE